MEIKESFECKHIINEMVKDCKLYSLKTPVILIRDKDKEYFKDYLLDGIDKLIVDFDTETIKPTYLFEGLCILISQNEIIQRSDQSLRIIAARKIAGLSQEMLANKIGCLQKDVSRWENGVYQPKINYLVKIAKACNIDISYLISE